MKKISFLLVIIFLSGCSRDLIEVANKNRLIQYPPIYDCRESYFFQNKTQIFTYLIDIHNAKKLFVRADIKSETNFQYLKERFLLGVQMPEVLGDVKFKESNYDLTDISETDNFIRYIAIDRSGNKKNYVIDKNKKQLIYEDDFSGLSKEFYDMAKSSGVLNIYDNSFAWDCKIK